MSPSRAARCVLIGVGNADRGDDGVGLEVAARVAALGLPGVEVRRVRGEATELLELFRCAPTVHVVDGMRSGAGPGTVLRIDARAAPLPARLSLGSTHGAGLAHAVELARALGRLPARLVVHAVEVGCVATGARLSGAVETGAAALVASVSKELASAAQGEPV